jgi:hypothetical protein
MKRVVTGVNEHGQSYVVSSEELPATDFQTLWTFDPSHVPGWINAIDPELAADWLGPEITGGEASSVTSQFSPRRAHHPRLSHTGHDQERDRSLPFAGQEQTQICPKRDLLALCSGDGQIRPRRPSTNVRGGGGADR